MTLSLRCLNPPIVLAKWIHSFVDLIADALFFLSECNFKVIQVHVQSLDTTKFCLLRLAVFLFSRQSKGIFFA